MNKLRVFWGGGTTSYRISLSSLNGSSKLIGPKEGVVGNL